MEIYNNISNLLNTISYKQSYEKLNEMHKIDNKFLNDPNIVVRLYSILCTYKYRQPLRRFILYLMEYALGSYEILESSQKIISNMDKDMF